MAAQPQKCICCCRATEYPALLLDQFRMAAEQAMAYKDELSEAWQEESSKIFPEQDRLLTSIVQLMVRSPLLAESPAELRGTAHVFILLEGCNAKNLPCWLQTAHLRRTELSNASIHTSKRVREPKLNL